VQHPVIFTLAGDHGVVVEGVSAFPQVVTAQMVENFARGGAAVNVLARWAGAEVIVADLGVVGPLTSRFGLRAVPIAPGTRNMARGPAMTRDEALAAVAAGASLVDTERAAGLGLAGLGEMGIGNTTAASAMTAALTGVPVDEVTGPGTGVDEAGRLRKAAVISRALEVSRPDPADPLDVLTEVGGLEIAGLVGVTLAAAAARIPVVVDGFISGGAALAAVRLAPGVRAYLLASHRSAEPGHRYVLEALGLSPYLDLGLRLGEGPGAALCIGLARSAIALLTEMAAFASAGVCGASAPSGGLGT